MGLTTRQILVLKSPGSKPDGSTNGNLTVAILFLRSFPSADPFCR
jgi:hypothetical protein